MNKEIEKLRKKFQPKKERLEKKIEDAKKQSNSIISK